MLVYVFGLIATSLVGNLLYDLLNGSIAVCSRSTLFTVAGTLALLGLAYVLWEIHVRNVRITTLFSADRTISPHAGLVWVLSLSDVELPIKAIEHHHERLQRMWAILVESDETTRHRYEELRELVAEKYPQVRMESVYVKDQNVKSYYEAVEAIYRHLVPAAHLTPQDVVTDFTGGLKPMSVGVALGCALQQYPLEYIASDFGPDNRPIEGSQRVVRIDIDFLQS